MKKTYFAPQVKVVAINGNSILAGSVKPTKNNVLGNGVQLGKGGFLDFEEESED